MNIISHRTLFISFSALLVIASIVVMSVMGFNMGIEFKGGSVLEVEYTTATSTDFQIPEVAEIQTLLAEASIEAQVQPFGDSGFIVRAKDFSEENRRATIAQLEAIAPEGTILEEIRFNSIGPSIGKELSKKAIIALVLVAIAIILFVAFTFRGVSKPISSWKYGVIAVIALVHDILIPTGIFVILGLEVNSLFVVGLLSILGLSVNDTIVVFDRIRENLRDNAKYNAEESFEYTVGKSLRQTIARSIMTSLTLVVVLVALYILGPESTQSLALLLLLGTIMGTYSSIFLASPLLVAWNNASKHDEE